MELITTTKSVELQAPGGRNWQLIFPFMLYKNKFIGVTFKKVNKKFNDLMEEHILRSVNNCLNTNIYSYLETSAGQSSNLYLNDVHCFNTSLN
jgi:hypothetical protein